MHCTKKGYHPGSEKYYSIENINNIKRGQGSNEPVTCLQPQMSTENLPSTNYTAK